jgi:toxin YoeB
MRVVFTREAQGDYIFWQETQRETVDRINQLITDIQRSPFTGIGKPEPLRREYAGWWSRRITGEHRLIYRVAGSGQQQRVEILSCRFHYGRRN